MDRRTDWQTDQRTLKSCFLHGVVLMKMGQIKKNLVTGCWLWSSKFDETKKSKASRTKVQSDLARISYGKQCSVYVSDPVRNRRTMSVHGPSHSNGSQFKVISISFFFRKMLYLSFCLSAMLSLHPYIPMTIFLSVWRSVRPSVRLSVHLSLRPSIHPSIPQSVQVKTDSFAPKSLCPPVLLSNCQSVLLSFCPPACPSVSLSVCLSVHLSIHPSVILSIQVKTNGSRS